MNLKIGDEVALKMSTVNMAADPFELSERQMITLLTKRPKMVDLRKQAMTRAFSPGV